MQNRKPRKEDQKKKNAKASGLGPYRARFMRGINGSDSIMETPFPQMAFVGRSNVGKSSTLNALLGVNGLARTSATPGKTQEINFFMVNDNMFFVDLPGYGYAKMPEKEAEDIRKHILWYLSGGEAKPRYLVLIVDVRHPLSDYDKELISVAQSEGHPLLILLNKVDTLNQKERSEALRSYKEALGDIPYVPFSAKTKEGVAEVRTLLFSK
jgi:GTP-binding protein